MQVMELNVRSLELEREAAILTSFLNFSEETPSGSWPVLLLGAKALFCIRIDLVQTSDGDRALDSSIW